MKPIKRLDPTWWCKTPGGYTQQDGRGRLVRLKDGTKVSWRLYVDGKSIGDWCWSTFAQAKRRAAEITDSELPRDELVAEMTRKLS